MRAGLTALYTDHDPRAAAAQFSRVLSMSPTHYGATYQLATALDQAGKPAEAEPHWKRMLAMAEASKDETTVAITRGRLQHPPANGEEAIQASLMAAALYDFYSNHDTTAGIAELEKLLRLNPNHYGATYQLAAALDRAGKRAEARPFWEKLLAMAERYDDRATLAVVRARLIEPS